MSLIWTAFRNSLPLQLVALGLMAWGALGLNNLYQRNVGASNLATKIEKKADDNARIADKVDEAVAAGRGRRPDPNRLR